MGLYFKYINFNVPSNRSKVSYRIPKTELILLLCINLANPLSNRVLMITFFYHIIIVKI